MSEALAGATDARPEFNGPDTVGSALPLSTASLDSPSPTPFSRAVLNFGFIVGVILSTACLALSALYLLQFEQQTTSVIANVIAEAPNAKPGQEITVIDLGLEVHTFVARTVLLSCGVFVGMAFGFMGFSLFLLGIQGDIDASAQGPNNISFRAARLSPGLFTILCATILVGLCATHPIHFQMSLNGLHANQAGSEQVAHTKPEHFDPKMPGDP